MTDKDQARRDRELQERIARISAAQAKADREAADAARRTQGH